MVLLAKYLLVGVITGCLLEAVVRFTGYKVTTGERVCLICGWPVMIIVFIYNFIKGFFNKD
jgi:hypothetical protein